MKKIIIIFCIVELMLMLPAVAQIQFKGFDGGWSYRNTFNKKLTQAYHIDWLVIGTFTYKSATLETALNFPTSHWGTRIPYYSARLTFPLYKTK
jgi:hypothetical protein